MVFQDTMNRWITSGLFKEIAQRPDYIIYTLSEARDLFIECNDPTGYIFSKKYLGGYQHWLALKESPAVAPHILQWEEELEIKLRAEALQNIYNDSCGEKSYQASKYLVEGGWKPKTMGRPSRAAIQKEARLRSAIYDEFKLKSVK